MQDGKAIGKDQPYPLSTNVKKGRTEQSGYRTLIRFRKTTSCGRWFGNALSPSVTLCAAAGSNRTRYPTAWHDQQPRVHQVLRAILRHAYRTQNTPFRKWHALCALRTVLGYSNPFAKIRSPLS